jgi:hypothetical protein
MYDVFSSYDFSCESTRENCDRAKYVSLLSHICQLAARQTDSYFLLAPCEALHGRAISFI